MSVLQHNQIQSIQSRIQSHVTVVQFFCVCVCALNSSCGLSCKQQQMNCKLPMNSCAINFRLNVNLLLLFVCFAFNFINNCLRSFEQFPFNWLLIEFQVFGQVFGQVFWLRKMQPTKQIENEKYLLETNALHTRMTFISSFQAVSRSIDNKWIANNLNWNGWVFFFFHANLFFIADDIFFYSSKFTRLK